jgi:hypothetical protein
MEERDMKIASRRLRSPLAGALLAALLAGAPAPAQTRDAYGAPVADASTHDEYGEIRQTVARISDITGSVSYARGDDPDNWQAADRNVPVTIGDRLYTDTRSRVELQLHGGHFVRIGAHTDLAVLNLTDDTRQFAVKSGVVSIQIRRLDPGDVFEVDTPNAAVTLEQPGDYRIDVDEAGNTRITVRQGGAQVSAGGGSVDLAAGDGMQIDGIDSPLYDIVGISAPDGWDRWVEGREQRNAQSLSYEYVSQDIAGVEDLDEHGRWETVPMYGRVWTPNTVAVDWAPYRAGQWIWQDPWGWTWVSAELWGWAPYHYGRWITYSSRWYWVPVARPVRFVTYSPALVAFVGGGPGWSATISVGGGGFVGWFPLAPRDPFIPWWGRRSNVQVTNITYVNRTYVTVVNQATFVGGGVVTNNFVRDRVVLREVTAAPVLRGPLPLMPTLAATRIAPRPGAVVAVRPSAAIVARPVVARIAPPPAPPTFEQKLAVIRTNRGAPVAPAEAAEIAVQDRRRPSASTAVRPVAADSGRVTLAPRGQAATSREVRPVAVAPDRGRAMATADRPVSSAPVAAPRSTFSRDEQGSREATPRPTSRAPAATESRDQRPTPRSVERLAPTVVVPRGAAAPPAQEQIRDRNSNDEHRRPTASTEKRATEKPPATPDRSSGSVQDRSHERSRMAPPTPAAERAMPRQQPSPPVVERAAPRPRPSPAAVERAAPRPSPTAAPVAVEKPAPRGRPTPKKKEDPDDKNKPHPN